ncbi:MAG TPA: serine/threonine-protein kinase [Anaerolineales bacterium]
MDNLQSGQMLGPYRIITQIGKGGMANVYKAYQPSVDRYVAIKVLPSQLAESQEFATRFHQEARIIAKLEHPHILPVFDYGESDGVAYFVMRYLDAGTLRDKMEAKRPLPLNEIDRIFTQLADALSYAHSFGIIHRDLKPANALIDSHGNIFLTDFGIARLLESASPRLTQTDAIMGTPAYISPEQAQGQDVDQRSDIYSLGIILYEMVTGGVPFVADTPLAVLFKHISDPLPLPSLVKPDIPPSIEKVILKALAKDPKDRFSSADEFVAAWKRALEDKETIRQAQPTDSIPIKYTVPSTQPQSKPAPVKQTASKSGMPTGWIVGCLAGACLLFSVAGVTVLGANWRNMPFLNPATNTPLPTETVIPIPPTDVPPPSMTSVVNNTAKVLLEDDFSVSRDGWGTLTDSDSSIEYESDALHMLIFTKNFVAWSTPNDQVYQNTHMEITAFNNDTDPTTAFGFICAQQSKDWSFYYLGVTPAGEYAIIKATDGESDEFLTNNGKWASSDLIPHKAASYRVGGDCGHGKLTLYVDGKQIASVSDNTYGSGRVGLFIWSGENVSSADVTFDDFLLTSLE